MVGTAKIKRREGGVLDRSAMTTLTAVSSPSAPPRGSQRVQLGWWESVSFTMVHAIAGRLLAGLSLPGLYRFARVFGTLEWLVNYRRRRRFGVVLDRVWDRRPTNRERRRASREFFMQARCDKLFYLVLDRIPRDQACGLLSIHNREVLDKAVARGRGVYVALSHHGALHVVGLLMALHGYKIAGVRDGREGALRRFVQERLDRRRPDCPKTRLIFADDFPREIYRCLRDGYLLASAMDVSRIRRVHQKTVEVEILGEKRRFLTGPLRIAIRCRAPVLQAFVIPRSAFHYRVEIVEMLVDPDEVSDEEAAIARAMPVYAANVERYLRAFPSLVTRV